VALFENLSTIKQLAERNPAFTEGSLRWHVFNANNNGLAQTGAIVRVGQPDSKRPKVLIDVPKFEGWLDAQRVRSAA
jgi:hypothetical protein